ncbi:hypothetical protein FB567DRAFT_617310, partial [Paraphoma chrysanthemicola]
MTDMPSAAIMDPSMLCTMCNEEGTLSCAGCHDIRYCSKTCQKMDWPLHKLVCKTWSQLYADRCCPLPGCKRGIWFSANEDRPRFVWLMPELQANGTVVNHGSSILENTTGMSVYAILNKNVIEILNRPIAAVSEGKRIYLSMDIHGEGAARKTVGKPSKAFEKIDTELVDYVRGRILAYGFVPDKNKFVDLTLADLRYVVDFYRSMYDKEMRDKIMRSSSDMVTGVRMDCVGDLAVSNELPYHSVDISMSEMASGEWDCPAAEKIGIPIIVKRLEPSLTWRGRKFDG